VKIFLKLLFPWEVLYFNAWLVEGLIGFLAAIMPVSFFIIWVVNLKVDRVPGNGGGNRINSEPKSALSNLTFCVCSFLTKGDIEMADKVQEHDKEVLHSMGYAQQLARRMGGFSNFAISFSIICILAGGISAFPAAFNSAARSP
jgi:hypothetical protein